jgi:hypothetical protein
MVSPRWDWAGKDAWEVFKGHGAIAPQIGNGWDTSERGFGSAPS